MKSVLVVAAHPDDETLGCGGTMARLAAEGWAVHILILAEGATSRDEMRQREARSAELSELAVCARQAAFLPSLCGLFHHRVAFHCEYVTKENQSLYGAKLHADRGQALEARK